MDGLIKTAWRAFWVGLGASAVLIGQSVLGPAPAPGPTGPLADPAAAPLVAPAPTTAPAAARVKSADPILSRNPFDSKTGPLVPRCANIARCS